MGGEAGQGARPIEADWARSMLDHCAAAGIPFNFKQWGGTNKKATGRLLDGVLHDAVPASWVIDEVASRKAAKGAEKGA